MKMLNKIIKREDGFALPAALVLLLLGGLLVIPTTSLTSTNLTLNRAVDEADRNMYAADAGIEYTYWQIVNNPLLSLPTVGQQSTVDFPASVNGKPVSVILQNVDGTTFRIESTSSSGSPRSYTTTSDVDIAFTGGGSSSSDVFDYALFSTNGDITLGGNTDVESDEVQQGDVYANNGNVYLSGNAVVNGDASATSSITTADNSSITGGSFPGSPQITTPVIDGTAYESETLDFTCVPVTQTGDWTISGIGDVTFSSPEHISGNMSISRLGTVTFEGSVCVDGNLTISSNANVVFNGPVKVGGTLSIESNNTVTFGSTLYIGSNLSTSGNAVINLGGVVYIGGALAMSGNQSAKFTGGQTIVVDGNITLTGNSSCNEAAENIPVIISQNGNITLAGNNYAAAIMYAPNGAVSLSGNSKLYGCAVGQSVTGSGNSRIAYPIDLRNREDLPGDDSGGGGGTTVSGITIRTYGIQ